MERWKTVDSSPNYEISSEGRVRNSKRNHILSPNLDGHGYLQLILCNNGEHKMHHIHRLVADAFCERKEGANEVNHIDGDKSNNRADNLEWCTRGENLRHAHALGLKKPSGPYPQIKVRVVETGEIFSNLHECARSIGGQEGSISHCVKGNRKTHRGYHFEKIYD